MNVPFTITECVAKVSRTSKVVLEEAEGSGKVWRAVGAKTVPKGRSCFETQLVLKSFGPAPFRIQVRQGSVITGVSATRSTLVYGPVSGQTYLKAIGTGYWDSPGIVDVPGFTYATIGAMFDNSGGTPWVANNKTTCRSLTLVMVMSSDNVQDPDQGTASLSMTQNSINEQVTSQFPDEQSFTYTFQLDGSIATWVYEDTGTNGNGLYFLPASTADCYTSNAL